MQDDQSLIDAYFSALKARAVTEQLELHKRPQQDIDDIDRPNEMAHKPQLGGPVE